MDQVGDICRCFCHVTFLGESPEWKCYCHCNNKNNIKAELEMKLYSLDRESIRKQGIIEGLILALNKLSETKLGCDINCMGEIEDLLNQYSEKN